MKTTTVIFGDELQVGMVVQLECRGTYIGCTYGSGCSRHGSDRVTGERIYHELTILRFHEDRRHGPTAILATDTGALAGCGFSRTQPVTVVMSADVTIPTNTGDTA